MIEQWYSSTISSAGIKTFNFYIQFFADNSYAFNTSIWYNSVSHVQLQYNALTKVKDKMTYYGIQDAHYEIRVIGY